MGRRAGAPRVRLDDEHGDVYQFSFTVNGVRQRGSTYCRDHEAALAEAQRLFGEAHAGKKRRRERPLKRSAATQDLKLLFATFVASLTGKRADSHLKQFKSHFRSHFSHRWATLDEIIAPGAIDSYASDRLAGRAPSVELNPRRPRPAVGSSVTVHKELVTLRQFLKWCKKMGHLDELPHVEPVPQHSDYKPPDYTPAQARRLLGALPDRRAHRKHMPVCEFFTVQWAQALRPGELESLRWLDVDLHRRVMTIRISEDKAREGRTIALATEAVAVLKALRRDGEPLPEALIFGAHDYRVTLENAAEACKLPRITRHNWRHFRLTELAHLPKVAPRALQFLAGHKHMSTTDKYLRSRTAETQTIFDAAAKQRHRRK